MEKLQESINPYFLGDHLNVECFEQKFINSEALRFEEEEEEEERPTLEDKMPFLQMLRSVETPSLFPFKEPKFQTLLTVETQIQALEFESCVTQKILDLHSPVKSETKDLLNPHSTHSCLEGLSSESNQENVQLQVQPNSLTQQTRAKQSQFSKSPSINREKRKRKRTKKIKNKEEEESQRMTHIAVERNRRRRMNNHLNTIRSFMPPSYVQRGDQASVIGGAIDFVKELEQVLHSLKAQKRIRMGTNTATIVGCDSVTSTSSNSTSTSTSKAILCDGYSKSRPGIGNCEEKMKAESKSGGAEIEVIVIKNHVNLKIHCTRRPGQLLKAIVALEDLRLTFWHLNITSSETTVHYCFNLKIEEECKLGSADEIAAKVHQTLSYINGS